MATYIQVLPEDLAERVVATLTAEDAPEGVQMLSTQEIDWFRQRVAQMFGSIGLYVAAQPPGE